MTASPSPKASPAPHLDRIAPAPAGAMQAVVCNEPGDLSLETRAIPVRGSDEVLVRVKRVGICGTDLHIFKGNQPFLEYPRIMGHELAGEVVEAPKASPLTAGSQVCVMPYFSCGTCVACKAGKPNCCIRIQVLGVHRDGALTEYLSVPERFVMQAEGISLDQAAMIEFLSIGAHAVARAGVKAGQKVLTVGVGPIGMGACLFSKLLGAEVYALDDRIDRLETCRDVLGVNHIVQLQSDPAATDATLNALTNGDFFDVVFDATGNAKAIEHGFRYVAHGGAYALISVVSANITFSDPEFHKREATLLACRNATLDDFHFVLDAMRKNQIPTGAFNTHRTTLANVPVAFPTWLNPSERVIKAIVEI